MKKLIVLLTIFMSQLSFAQQSQQCTIVSPLKPGGAFDSIIRILQKYNPDITHTYKPGAYSLPAIDYADKNPEVAILSLPAMYSKNSPEKNPNVEILKIIGSYDHGIITSKNIKFSDLLTKKVNIGVNFLGSPGHIIAEQIRLKNPNAQLIPFGGDSAALVPLKMGDVDAYVSAFPSIDKWHNEYQFKILAKIGTNDVVQDNVTMMNVSRVGIFMSKNATDAQKERLMKCIDTALNNEELKKEFRDIFLTPLNITGKEANKHIQKYIDTLNLYGI